MTRQMLIARKVLSLLIATLAILPPPCVGGLITTDVSSNGTNENDLGTESPSDSVDEVYQASSGSSIWGGIDILVAVFFVVAAVWLFLAITYSLILLVLLRLQARGRLDTDNANFGRLICCNGRFSLYFGCIIRRFATRLEIARNRETPTRRIMTREERRAAMESLLCSPTDAKLVCMVAKAKTDEDDEDDGGPVCTICLSGYDQNAHVFRSDKCQHCFHKECIMDWLERRDNTECPVCRETMVSSEKVWTYVENKRKEQRPLYRILQRCKRWYSSSENTTTLDTEDENSSPSLTDDEEIASDVDQDASGRNANEENSSPSLTDDEFIASDIEQGVGSCDVNDDDNASRSLNNDEEIGSDDQGAGGSNVATNDEKLQPSQTDDEETASDGEQGEGGSNIDDETFPPSTLGGEKSAGDIEQRVTETSEQSTPESSTPPISSKDADTCPV